MPAPSSAASPSPARFLGPRPSDRPLRRSGGDALLVGALVLLLGFGGMFVARWWRQGFTRGISGPVPQGAYVWQRQWTDPVRDAVRGAVTPVVAGEGAAENGEPPPLSTLAVFCAEIGPPTGGEAGGAAASVLRVGDVDWPLLAGLPRPVGLVIRVRTFPNAEVGPEREPFPTLRRVLDDLLEKCAAAGLRPAEVQVDCDAPPGKLPGYAAALAALRTDYPAQRFIPTVFPAWLGAPGLPDLVKGSGEFVLQFAGPERLNGPDRRPPQTRCTPLEVADAVARAARTGVPFRVALPTDGFRLVLDADGRLVAAVSEGPLLERRRPPAGGSERLLLADAGDMARLVEEWTDRRPATLRGILWHRLPIAGERLNWPPPTLRAVTAGRVPRPKITWQLSAPGENGQRELTLRNVGEAVAILPPTLSVNSPVDPLAVEPAAPYEIIPPDAKRPPHTLLFRRRDGEDVESLRVRVPPGEGFLVSTIRLPEDAPDAPPGEDEIAADMDAEPAPPAPAETSPR